MDIFVFSNFECFLWFFVYEFVESVKMDLEWNKKQVGQEVSKWFKDFKIIGLFGFVYQDVLKSVKCDFESECVMDEEIFEIIKDIYQKL